MSVFSLYKSFWSIADHRYANAITDAFRRKRKLAPPQGYPTLLRTSAPALPLDADGERFGLAQLVVLLAKQNGIPVTPDYGKRCDRRNPPLGKGYLLWCSRWDGAATRLRFMPAPIPVPTPGAAK